jgi:hypothetical protein
MQEKLHKVVILPIYATFMQFFCIIVQSQVRNDER